MTFKHSPYTEISAKLGSTSAITKRLWELNDKVQKKSAAKAARAGMNVVKKAAIANALKIDDEKTQEQIAKNITVRNAPRSGRRVGGVVMRVGVRGGAKAYSRTKENMRKHRIRADGTGAKKYKTLGDASNPGGDTWYWRFLEFGTEKMRARPFLQRALSDNTGIVTEVVIKKLQQETLYNSGSTK